MGPIPLSEVGISTILITGATGTIGTATVNALLQKGHTIRVGTRSPEKGEALKQKGAIPVAFEWGNASQIAEALNGVDKVFLLTPSVENQVEIANQLVDAAKAAGVKHIVKLSAIGCDIEPGIQLGRWHRAIEKYIEASGIAYTFLRPNNFSENFLNFYPPAQDGAIYLPLGDGKISWIEGADIGEIAANILAGDPAQHAGKAYVLTGSEALNLSEVAEILKEASGSNIRYVDVPESAARSAMEGFQMPKWFIDAMMELHAVGKAGYASWVGDDAKNLLGRSPRTVREFARANAARFTR